jgi:flagellar biosynthesis protein FlhA
MAKNSLALPPSAGAPLPAGLTKAFALLAAHRDIAFALGIVLMMVILVVPLPPIALDFGLALSFTFAVLILMVPLWIERPLEFSVFPTVLLLATMTRLALNVVSTRLILSHGHEGAHAAGGVIAAFGKFVMGGQPLIGAIVFVILLIVNFLVITKGSTRIAEVSARFTLDAMPGKQMAIDADLAAGAIDDAEARRRRQELQEESSFMGAMDGASKFVKGDAVAGLLITIVNFVGGTTIGVAIHGKGFSDAALVYGLLTVGDGLITQIPALLVSFSAGMLVAKGNGGGGRTERVFASQLGRNPQALGVAAGLMGAVALLPGLPFAPFALFAGVLGSLAWFLPRLAAAAKLEAEQPAAGPAEGQETLAQALQIDPLRIDLETGLAAAFASKPADDADPAAPGGVQLMSSDLVARILKLRNGFMKETGFVIPEVRIRDSALLERSTYAVYVRNNLAAKGKLLPDRVLVVDVDSKTCPIPGEDCRDPAFNLPARWIDRRQKDEAIARGLTVVTPVQVLMTHFMEVVREHVGQLLGYAELQKLLETLDKDHRTLFGEICPGRVPPVTVQRVLQNLLVENVSIRDMGLIVEAIAEGVERTRDPDQLTEQVRRRLAWQICTALKGPDGMIPALVPSDRNEQMLGEGLRIEGDQIRSVHKPSDIAAFIGALEQAVRSSRGGTTPVLIVTPVARRFVRQLVTRSSGDPTVSRMAILGTEEIHPKARLKILGRV